VAPADFTIFLALQLPSPWPPWTPLVFYASKIKQTLVLLKVHVDGHLEVAVSDSPGAAPFAAEHFQRLGVTGPNRTVLCITFGDGNLAAYINGKELSLLAKSPQAVFEIPQLGTGDPQLSYLHPEAAQACQHAIAQREDRISSRPRFQPRVESREKSLTEQLIDLRDGVDALRQFNAAAMAGDLHLLPVLAAQLRALIYWPPREKDRPTWNPLLIRLANIMRAPLPVFAAIEKEDAVPDIVKAADSRFANLKASCRRRSPTDKLVDLETYLAFTVLSVKTASGMRTATVSDVFAATANTMGSAHYGETVPLYLDDLQAHLFLERTLLHFVIFGLAQVVSDLGGHLLSTRQAT